ncbi:MAG: hypothetical protein KAI63_01640 [Planctomycetes bacterium]|nr:hypothetical protein [Planctomycetota bacterium]
MEEVTRSKPEEMVEKIKKPAERGTNNCVMIQFCSNSKTLKPEYGTS